MRLRVLLQIKITEACINRRSYHRTCRTVRIAALMELGRTADARAEAQDFAAHAPGLTVAKIASYAGYSGDAVTHERLMSRLREAGLLETQAASTAP
jgi:hypothetical protein